MPKPDYDRIHQLEVELGIVEAPPETAVKPTNYQQILSSQVELNKLAGEGLRELKAENQRLRSHLEALVIDVSTHRDRSSAYRDEHVIVVRVSSQELLNRMRDHQDLAQLIRTKIEMALSAAVSPGLP